MIIKVPTGEGPNTDEITFTVWVRGEEYNLWESDTAADSRGYEELSRADAQFWALELSPGTLMPADVDDLDVQMQDMYGRALADWTTQEGVDLETYLSEYTERWPAGHPMRKEPPIL